MAMVVVISLPLILFSVMLGVGCYLIGRARGRQDIRTHAQTFGVPVAPPNACPEDQSPSSCSKSKILEMPRPICESSGSFNFVKEYEAVLIRPLEYCNKEGEEGVGEGGGCGGLSRTVRAAGASEAPGNQRRHQRVVPVVLGTGCGG
ncbi:hypothetical protein L1987_38870 [Smallanthus sonchifolius]|uniref:Uncharacterized protein n=1 Tax=Smallanthus sonchifolius TaxID=185202 RepID=A0ACB9HKG0_9ASTR|nr:hypothetical protein L1987_38870 [Smallanthus sonchifolius]